MFSPEPLAFAPAPCLGVSSLRGCRRLSVVRPASGPSRRVCSKRAVPRAAQSLESYRSLEGFGDAEAKFPFLPNAIIYSSLRRRAERMCVDAALELFKDIASKGIVAQTAVLPSKVLSPREVVHAVLDAVRSRDSQAVLQFASDKNPFKEVSANGLFDWLQKNDEFAFLLNISSYFVAPQGRTFGPDRRSCVISCVINTAAGTKHALSFNMSKDRKSETWQVDSIFLG